MARSEEEPSQGADTGDEAGRDASDLRRFGVNAGAALELRERFARDPGSVHPSWAAVFAPPRHEVTEKHARVLRLIHSYRARGHRVAATDPLGASPSYFPELDPAHYGLSREDLERPFLTGDLPGGPVQPLAQILERLRATYCRSVGVEFTHVQDPGRKQWLQRRMEESRNETPLAPSGQLEVLEKLAAAELFERFLHTRFLGQKRFSLEGAEALIPLLDTLVEEAADQGAAEIVLGMAHRGRLNVLSNILGKSLESLFCEFEDVELAESPFGSGDVKYHKGYSSDRVARCGAPVHLSLTANPSHLEAVDPVVLGRTRAKQGRRGDVRRHRVIPVLVHGDAAFAGQGIVAEALNLCHLRGYSTGGTIHVVVNNQIGFTTNPNEARSTLYCTDVAKMIQAPILHVNGDDPEAVVHCAKLALAWRQRFGTDAVIDLVCYRRHGHNEGDEPSFTQPLLYARIRDTKPVRERYTATLLERAVLQPADAARIEAEHSAELQSALARIQTRVPEPDEPYDPRGPWVGTSRTRQPGDDPDTAVPIERLAAVAERLGNAPPGFALHPKLEKLLERRRKAVADGGPIDWALAEALAFGSLVGEGTAVRVSGQDSSRGTFNQRHAVLVDQATGDEFAPLDHLAATQARFEVYDSQLSEAAVLGFEYGFSLADPSTLVLWEAQFGDFANGAQVVIDQFIAAAHAKWQRMSALVLLLPHGYEGQGPEHSSARVERFLQLCAEDNLQVANCTTPAQYFHLLRRQIRRRFRAPLVVFTPKSLLRDPRATSAAAELASGRFQPVLDDAALAPGSARRVLLSSGKVYYDLLERREARAAARGGARDVALVRVEELYPWPAEVVAAALARQPGAEVAWVQEEPENMGPFGFVAERIRALLPAGARLRYAGRAASASPAVGSGRIHRREQAELVDAAFADLD